MMDALRRFKTARLLRQMSTRDCGCDDPLTAAPSETDELVYGVAVPFDQRTGDGRMIKAGAITWDLDVEAVPIIWDPQDEDHTGGTVGVLDSISDDGAALNVTGRLFDFDGRDKVLEMIDNNALGWSVMMDDEDFEIQYSEPEITEEKDGSTKIRITREQELMTLTHGRLRHLALVNTPAFPVARPVRGTPPALAAAAQMYRYPAAHFERWESKDPVPLQVTDDGRVWGHAAGDGCYRNGDKSSCTKYTRDPDPAMRNFHTASLTLDDGTVIRVGSLTCASLHASTHMSYDQQRTHHEDTSTVWARVQMWDDSRGRLCVAGSVVPNLDKDLLAQVAGLPVSVEKWPVTGTPGLTLVGAHTVPTPAWPVVTA